ncbi:replication-relaxation family protein [Nocardiopsis composta]
MRTVYRHRTLTTDQIAKLEFGSYASAKNRLLVLYRLRALERFRPWIPAGSAPGTTSSTPPAPRSWPPSTGVPPGSGGTGATRCFRWPTALP